MKPRKAQINESINVQLMAINVQNRAKRKRDVYCPLIKVSISQKLMSQNGESVVDEYL